ncbi:cation-transporting ATPase E [Streptomyces sp. SceaMP-e96]|uniref:cation-translocating P-type ATPase n=1 Tax=Streptomyces TaxID=1883 RepID=UPI0008239167|nr:MULTISPECIES: cation-translocating P-type ATPase [unclassified Streptomyces]MYT16137.1 HAD-IC family P-type ATPase [Streptomyces sp. SID4951]SCK30588.1 cation-transporting ATPase E [Streptomyces sp. SceaMP-e96]
MDERLETSRRPEGTGDSTAVDELSVPAARAAGLTSAEVASRVAEGAVNDVEVRSSRSIRDIIRANVCTRINAVIGVLFVIILAVGPIQDGLFGGVILANTLIGVIQEVRAKRTLDRLAIVGEARNTVRRDGSTVELAPAQLVLDDVIELGPGDKAAVDGVVLESESLEVDESLLTGEADPVFKRPGDKVMSGCFVVAGTGAFTATRVGRDAYAAQLTEEARRFTLVNSELRNGINTILKFVTYAIIPAAIALILSQLAVGSGDIPEAVRRMVAGLVPMVPEGLVLLTSVAFAVGVIRLGKMKCLIQELPAIEGLARVDTVCLDKTGTLTEMSMAVDEVHQIEPGVRVAEVLGALGAADPRPNASMKAITDSYPASKGWAEQCSVPFSTARRWSGATLSDPCGRTSTWLIGAADVLLPPGHAVLVAVDSYGTRGLRVLLLARSSISLTKALEHGWSTDAITPVALVVVKQRTRKEAPATLRYFAEQGVKAKVISGDNALSVSAVARGLGLPGSERHVDARNLPEHPDQLADSVEANAIFGRVGPQQKRDMVTALQSRGHTVAMTGDGVNDVLALKDADVAVSMGTGSPAARSVAQIVLLDNNFSSLPSVVAEGRRVIGNIERVANLFLTKTIYSVILAIVVVLANVPYPFLPRHLTLVGSLTIGIPAFFLALAPNTERAQPHFVRRVLKFAIPCGALAAAATMTSYTVARSVYGGNLEAETSAATLTLFLVGLWALAIIARPYTWWRILLVLAMAVSFAAVLVIPFLQKFFQLELVGTTAPWAAVGLATAAGLVLEGIFLFTRRRAMTRRTS